MHAFVLFLVCVWVLHLIPYLMILSYQLMVWLLPQLKFLQHAHTQMAVVYKINENEFQVWYIKSCSTITKYNLLEKCTPSTKWSNKFKSSTSFIQMYDAVQQNQSEQFVLFRKLLGSFFCRWSWQRCHSNWKKLFRRRNVKKPFKSKYPGAPVPV